MHDQRLKGLSLFSGIGGLELGLSQWIRTIAYCEQDRYAQGVLLSRMRDGSIDKSPIATDVRSLRGDSFLTKPDIIFGGFPCQDISVAGVGKGIHGERSGLFFEIVRLVDEIKPTFVFLENVPAIRTRGLSRVVQEFSSRGYLCRWTCVSAEEVGAPHLRKRWFFLASNTLSDILRIEQGRGCGESREDLVFPRNDGEDQSLADSAVLRWRKGFSESEGLEGRYDSPECSSSLAHPDSFGCTLGGIEESPRVKSPRRSKPDRCGEVRELEHSANTNGWWVTEPQLGRVAHGVSKLVDRLRCLGNAVVPEQAKTAFERLMGFVSL